MSAITSQNAANAIVKLVANDALQHLLGTLVMGKLVNRNFEPQFANAGDVINVPIPPVLKANNLAENGQVQNQVASLGNAQIVLNSHAEASFQITDVVKVLTNQDLTKMYMQAAINAVAEQVETDLMKMYTLLTDNATLGGAAPATEALVDDAETALFKAKVPMNEPRYFVVTAGTYSDLRQLPRFSETATVGAPAGTLALQEGVVGRMKNFEVMRSHYVQTVGGVAKNLAFSRDALALVTRRLPQPLPGTGAIVEYAEQGSFGMRVVMSYAPNTLAQQFTIDVLYGVGTLRNQFGLVAETNT